MTIKISASATVAILHKAGFDDVYHEQTGGGVGVVYCANHRIGVGPFAYFRPNEISHDVCVCLYDEDGNDTDSVVYPETRMGLVACVRALAH